MNRSILVTVLVLCASAAPAAAQELNLATTSTERPHVVHVRTGLDHGFTAEVGYDHVLAVGDRLVLAGVELALPWAEPDFGDYEVRPGVTAPVFELGAWKLVASLGPTVRGSDSAVARMTALGVDARVSAGYHARRGFVAAESGVDWAAATHIAHSDEYRMRVYPDAEDGWYRSTGGTIRAGVHGGLSFDSFDLVLRAGRTFAIDLDSQTIPFYASVGVNIAR